MKALRKPLVFVSALISAVLLLSWTLSDHTASTLTSTSFTADALTGDAMLTYLTENADHAEMGALPAAEDVLVQRIPGDNSHLLLMAFYSKENYSAPSITIENGFPIVLRDDGKGVDKTAGDGLYTAKIPANVAEFRSQAIGIAQRMQANGYKPMRYIQRQMVLDPDATENFQLQKFDANEPVSISGLTNVISADASTPSASVSSSSPFSSSPSFFAPAMDATRTAIAKPTTLDSVKANSVFITNLAVVEDPTRTWNYCTQTGNASGAWTFGTLMRQMASKSPTSIATDAQVSTFVKTWLNQWMDTLVINGDTVAARTAMNSQILGPWLTKSQNAGSPAGQLDMRFAPFKLTAITNRFDLRLGQRFAGTSSPCGEARFVFCLIKSDCTAALPMTIIFEYGINKPATCEDEHAWAQQWVNLKNFTLGSSSYNQALQNITDQFTLCGTNPSKPNQCSIDQVRTNEITLAPKPKHWELREFTLDSATGNLKESTVAQTPADKYNAQVINADVARFANYVNQNKKAIKAGKDTIPVAWKKFPFLGGVSHITSAPTGRPPNIYHWDGTDSTSKSTYIVDNLARSFFALETCGGCHAGESQTAFTHVDTAFFGKEAGLSGFLTGKAGGGGAIDFDGDSTNGKMTIKDAALRPSSTNPNFRTFSDIKARASALTNFVSTTCGTVLSISSQLLFQPLNMAD